MNKKLEIAIIYPSTNLEYWNFIPVNISNLTIFLKKEEFSVKQIDLDIRWLYHKLMIGLDEAGLNR